jgi:hypothetical protein
MQSQNRMTLAALVEHPHQQQKCMSCYSALESCFDWVLVENCRTVSGIGGVKLGRLPDTAHLFGTSGTGDQIRPVKH